MKRTILLLCCFAATAAFWSPVFGETARADEVVSREAAASKVEQLLVSHVWSWTDERHPGNDNPSRASVARVAGETPAAVGSFSEVGD
jgi:hypothetical protein